MQNTAPALQEQPLNLLADWISREQLAGALGLAIDTLARWEARQLGPPCTRIGRKGFIGAPRFRTGSTRRNNAARPK